MTITKTKHSKIENMHLKHKINLKYKLLFALLLPSILTFAQQNPGGEKPQQLNMVAIIIVVISVVLAFVIWGLGNILTTLSQEVMKKRKSKSIITIILLGFLAISSLPLKAQESVMPKEVASSPNYGGLDATSFWILVFVISIEVITILFLLFNIKRIQSELADDITVLTDFDLSAWWKQVNNKFFTKAVPVEREKDILIDHDYDGIQELDNSLPPWWKYGFYITIAVSVFYMFYFHFGGPGKNPTQEYEIEMENAALAMVKFNAASPNKVDENNIVLPSAAGVAEGEKIYHTSCWPCHGKSGEGTVGPNLTDKFWIHKGSLNDIYQSIKHGYPDKGMPAWEKNYSPSEISNLVGYIKSLAGTNPPGGKLPEGEMHVDENSQVAVDSASTK